MAIFGIETGAGVASANNSGTESPNHARGTNPAPLSAGFTVGTGQAWQIIQLNESAPAYNGKNVTYGENDTWFSSITGNTPVTMTYPVFYTVGCNVAEGNAAIAAYEGGEPGPGETWEGFLFYAANGIGTLGVQYRQINLLNPSGGTTSYAAMMPGKYQSSYGLNSPGYEDGVISTSVQLVSTDGQQIIDITPAGGISNTATKAGGNLNFDTVALFGRNIPWWPQITYSLNIPAMTVYGAARTFGLSWIGGLA